MTTNAEITDAVLAEMGWKWMAWVDRPTRSTPGYPDECSTRQFMSTGQLADTRWRDYLKENNAEPATGDEPLNYTYCSSGCSAARPPDFFTDANDDLTVFEFMKAEWGHKRAGEFIAALAAIRGRRKDVTVSFSLELFRKTGDYARAMYRVLKSE